MKLAIDLDNTILDYSSSISKLANKFHIPIDISRDKQSIKEYFKNNSNWPENWIKFQGVLYGEEVLNSKVSPSFISLCEYLNSESIDYEIVSHKTASSYCGSYNLQLAAKKRLEAHTIFKDIKISFHETVEEKVSYINSKFDIIIDDLESVLDQISSDKFKLSFNQKSSKYFHTDNWETISYLLKELLSKKHCIKTLSRKVINVGDTVFKVLEDNDRHEREIYFRDRLYPSYTPKLLTCPIKSVIKSPFIQTKAIKVINKEMATRIANFLIALKENDFKHYATHSCSNTFEYIEIINSRLQQLHDHPLYSRISKIFSSFTADMEEISCANQQIIYPDFCKNNFHLNSNDELIVFDYESVGRGDPARALLNFVHHFEHSNEVSEFKIILDVFSKSYNDDKLFERARCLYDLNALEWICIACGYNKDLNLVENKLLIMEDRVSKNLLPLSWKYEFYEYLS